MCASATWRRVLLLAAVLVVGLSLPGCKKSKVGQDTYDKISNGMALNEVQALLGPGEKDESGDGSGVAAQVGVDVGGAERGGKGVTAYVWASGSRTIRVFFVNGKVTNKQKEGF